MTLYVDVEQMVEVVKIGEYSTDEGSEGEDEG